MSDRQRDEAEMTAVERRFVAALRSRVDDVDIWLHATHDASWLIASFDVVQDGRVARTWRVDFDQLAVTGGLSPASLNWDDGLSAAEAGISTQPPLGLPVTHGTPEDLAELVADWLSSVSASS